MLIYNVSLYFNKDLVTGAAKRFEFISKELSRLCQLEIVVLAGQEPSWASEYNIRVWSVEKPVRFGRLGLWLKLNQQLMSMPSGTVINDFMPVPFYGLRKHEHYQMVHDVRNVTEFHRAKSKVLGGRFQLWQWGQCPAFVVVSAFTAESMRALTPALAKKRFLVSPNGLEAERFIQRLNNELRDIDVLYVATLERRKNHKVLLEAIAENTWIKRVVFLGRDLGEGEKLKQLAASIQASSQSLRIDFIDHVNDEEALIKLYACSRLYISSSLYEGFGMPLLEALASGCAVLCSDIQPHIEICGAKAQYFKADTEKELVKLLAMQDAVAMPEKQKQGVIDCELVNQYSWRSIARKLLDELSSSSTKDKLMSKLTDTTTEESFNSTTEKVHAG